MTNQGDASGPSLFQARSTRHNHVHKHDLNHQHLHLHQHRRLHTPEADITSPHIRSPPNEKLHGRQVVVVQTVSVVHYIDATGAVTSVDTLTSDTAAPTAAALPAGLTAALPALGDVLPTVSLPSLPSLPLSGLLPGPADDTASSTTSAESETSSSTLSASPETLTSTPFSSTSAFPTLSGVTNSSSSTRPPSLFGNHTIGLFSNHSRTSSSSSRSIFASTKSSSSLWTSTTDTVTIVAGGTDGRAKTGAGATAAVPVPVEPTPEPTGLAPETRNAVVGGVVGSIAGIALIAVALLYMLKWRRQRGQGIMLLGDEDRGRGFSSPGPTSPSSGMGMAERTGAFAIPSALAKLSGKRAIDAPAAGPATQEKGFYRVSGKKLVSVLESGGDGYTDPHDSIGSGSSYYRDSQAFSESSNPFQLGSPMRPVSGVPIYRDGAQRTPLHEHGPLPPGHRPSVFPTTLLPPDAAGRSFAPRDGLRGSASRFMEDT
ncbi:hypothetical protein F5144DRAFT_350903 [Chaetomium tenue]|uniref:Uncharacterized protein n=1 Tax=Chaetomium tenue TaxID=1854479 RepID=A0ACB7P0H1_9PEZI|nr:hypothetical protein F5144DRAFT_350903 [Chaetomium globosum]